jgi:DNA-binding LacI/PurR family transcriptional regulator
MNITADMLLFLPEHVSSDFMQKKITSREIAQLAGVHQSTVSRALNPDTAWRISLRKREEIRNLCRQYGVLPSRSVKKYAFERTRRIAWIFGAMERDLNGLGRSAFIRNMCDILQASGYILELIRLDYRPEKQVKNVRKILNSGMADVYIVGARMLNGQSLELLHKNSTRLILTLNEEIFRTPYPDYHWLSYFYFNNSEAFGQAFAAIPPEHRRKILYFGRDICSSEIKIENIRRLLHKTGSPEDTLSSLFHPGDQCVPTEMLCRIAGNFLLEHEKILKEYTTFWCEGLCAYPLYDHLRRLGRIPGRDFTVITHGDYGKLIPPAENAFNVIARNIDLEAEKLCEKILSLVDNPQPENTLFKAVFIPANYENDSIF